jgi:hypothetical protein
MYLSTRISVKKSAGNNRKSDDTKTGAFCSGEAIEKPGGKNRRVCIWSGNDLLLNPSITVTDLSKR